MDVVVHYHHITQVLLLEQSQVLHIAALFSQNATGTAQQSTYQRRLWVQMKEDRCCVGFGRGSEHKNLVVHTHIPQELHSVGSDIHADVGSVGVSDGHLAILLFFHSVDQRLVQVQDQDLALAFFDLWQLCGHLGAL